jgi:hypothetical protein
MRIKMTKQILVSAAGVFAAVAMMSGQETDKTFQVFGKAKQKMTVVVAPDTFGSKVVKGKPFAATEERHFLQVLSDGTRVETRQTTRIYRDGEGRMRMEDTTTGGQTQPGFEFGPITIIDPVSNTRTAINPEKRQKLTQPGGGMILFQAAGNPSTVRLNGQITIVQPRGVAGELPPVENLGMKNVNGVMAQGERTTSVIPAGEIGNNREIRVVTERWYSDDLQLLIKSTNTDPRFGDTTYQLTGISQGEQSPSLFQVPADYTEATGRGGGGARGGRSGGPGPVPPPAPAPPGARGGRSGGPGPAPVPAPGTAPGVSQYPAPAPAPRGPNK